MFIVFVCHTENDPNSKEPSFSHLPLLIDLIKELKVPITFSLMVGGTVGGGLLKFLEKSQLQFPENCEKAIHLHQPSPTQPTSAGWVGLGEREIESYFQMFEKVFGKRPRSVVFGKWQIIETQVRFLASLGIERDGSWIPKFHGEHYIVKPPFYFDNLLEVPPAADGKDPLNPFTRLSHFFLLRKIIKKYHQKNLVLHIAFHSYDLFNFGEKPKLRPIKRCVLRNLLKMINKYGLEMLTLSDIPNTSFEGLEKIKWPIFSRVFKIIGH